MDFTFGKLISDELKLTNHRASLNGIQHQHRISPLDPAPGEAVTAHLVSASDMPLERAWLSYTIDGSDPRASDADAQRIPFQPVSSEWDTLVWDYIKHWEAVIPGQEDGSMVCYYIAGVTAAGEVVYADYPDAEERVQHATMLYFQNIEADSVFSPSPAGAPPLFYYHVDDISAPDWAQDAIIYHIFLDRFYPGDGVDWLQTGDMQGFCGGTLWGVRDKLDYLAELGINCLWLSPTWESPSNHGYDIVDYQRTEARLGGDEALHAVIEGAHRRGMRVLLDLVCNHISNEHPIFLDAFSDGGSAYRDWFTFDQKYPHGYRGFFNVKTMPEINLEVRTAREWMIGNGIANLKKFDVDGFRLDYASGAGPNFWTHFRPRVKAVKPDCLLLGEIIDTPEYLRRYRGRLDGCLDFFLNEALRQTFAWGAWDERRLSAFCDSHSEFFGAEFVLPSFLDNHDMDRFSYIMENDSAALKRAAAAQFRLPNPPVILYGTEVGLRQRVSTRGNTLDVSRVPMAWGAEQDEDLLAFYQEQIKLRKRQ